MNEQDNNEEIKEVKTESKPPEKEQKKVLDLEIKPMGDTFKEMADEWIQLAKIIEKTQPDRLEGYKTFYKKIIIGDDLFYEGKTLTRPITPYEVAIILSPNQKKELLSSESNLIKQNPQQNITIEKTSDDTATGKIQLPIDQDKKQRKTRSDKGKPRGKKEKKEINIKEVKNEKSESRNDFIFQW